MDRLVVDPERMQRNLDAGGGVVFSQRVLLALVEAGLSREKAYTIVQKHALDAWNKDGSFRDNLARDRTVRKHFSESELATCFSVKPYLKHATTILKRSVPRGIGRK